MLPFGPYLDFKCEGFAHRCFEGAAETHVSLLDSLEAELFSLRGLLSQTDPRLRHYPHHPELTTERGTF